MSLRARRQTVAHRGELAHPNRRIAWEKPRDSHAWVGLWTRAGAACLASEIWPCPVKQEKVANANLPRLGGASHVVSTRARYATSALSLRARSRLRCACAVKKHWVLLCIMPTAQPCTSVDHTYVEHLRVSVDMWSSLGGIELSSGEHHLWCSSMNSRSKRTWVRPCSLRSPRASARATPVLRARGKSLTGPWKSSRM